MAFVTKLFDRQPDSVIWFTPVFSSDKKVPVDFKVGYCNTAACHILKATKEQVLKSRLLSTTLMDEVSRQRIFDQCMQVWNTGEHVEFTYHSPGMDKYFSVQRSKVENGILCITRDSTLLEKTRQEKNTQADLLDQLLSNSPYGISLYEAIRNKEGKIEDFRHKLSNQKTAEIIAFSLGDLNKYTVKELMLIRGQTGYFEMCVKVVETGTPVYTEIFAKPRNQWVGLSIVKFNDGYLLNYLDITATKALEKQAVRQAEMLQSVLNASLTGLFALEAVYGFSGKVLDFKFSMFNKAAEELLKITEEEKTKTFLTVFPVAKTNGLFDKYVQVIETGKPVKTELSFSGDKMNGMFTLSISKMGDKGLVQSFNEIVPRPAGMN